MILKLKLSGLEIPHSQSFCLIRKANDYFEVATDYQMYQYGQSNIHICDARLIHKQTLTLTQITDYHSFLVRDCEASVLKRILTTYSPFVKSFDFLIFSQGAYNMNYDAKFILPKQPNRYKLTV